MEKPFAQSCVENRDPIFSVLAPRVEGCETLIEIGSGTGQHAVYFGSGLPSVIWQTSDRQENHAGILAWLDDAKLSNVNPPLMLDVLSDTWPDGPFDCAFSANTAHIMPEDAVVAMFGGIGRVLRPDGIFLLYGPFNYDGRFTAPSNARFDASLRQRNPSMGIRDVGWLRRIAESAGLFLVEDIEMPVNNRTLIWRKPG